MPVYMCEVKFIPRREGIGVFVTGETTGEAFANAIKEVNNRLKESNASEFLTYKVIDCKLSD